VPRAKIPAWIAPGEPFEGKGASGVAVVLDPTPSAVGGFFCLLSGVALVLLSPQPSAPPLATWPEGITSTAVRLSFPRLGLPPPGPLMAARDVAVASYVLRKTPRVVPCILLPMLPWVRSRLGGSGASWAMRRNYGDPAGASACAD
jgi:hypothetical protein